MSGRDARANGDATSATLGATAPWYPKTVSGLSWTAMDGAFRVSRAGERRIHIMPHTGVLLLELSNGHHTVDEMIAILRAAFLLERDPDVEVRRFLDHAVHAGLVE